MTIVAVAIAFAIAGRSDDPMVTTMVALPIREATALSVLAPVFQTMTSVRFTRIFRIHTSGVIVVPTPTTRSVIALFNLVVRQMVTTTTITTISGPGLLRRRKRT